MSANALLESPAPSEFDAPEVDTAPVAAPKRSPRYESLDMWRGLCCLMLVVFHTTMQTARHYFIGESGTVNGPASLGLWIASRAWVGVPIFFVISGYCIMATLHARQKKGGVIEFAKRRFWRIYPPYWIAIGLSTIAILALNARWGNITHDGVFTVPLPQSMTGWEWLGNLTLTESWRHCVFGGDATQLLPNTWTLCYEEQFYFVAALILMFAPRRIFAAAAVVTGVVLVGKTIAWKAGADVKGSLFDGGWFQIAAGILLYYRVNKATPLQKHLIHAVLVVGVLISLRNPARLLEFDPNGDVERFVACSFALLASFLYPYDQTMRKSAWLTPLRFVGGMSYSVYLMHPLIAKSISYGLFRSGVQGNTETLLIVLPLCLVASLAGAYVFHRLIERHFIPPVRPSGTAASIDLRLRR